eukprot:TRINITY_DN19839_c0_g2_i1.p1 TRINITY_DN19839_c0_g2~~TRINITY_DN19839_c0_g2_i1.p1  ORF type:complete len:377 (-),score=58.73 TRINITY_DN19839_c0_g2_i1:121-1251(-)
MASINRQWIVLQQPQGAPIVGKDVELREVPRPALTEGEILVRVTSMSLDPYMRGTMNQISYGVKQKYPRVMTGGGVGQVVESRNPSFRVGELVQGQFGWQDYFVSDGSEPKALAGRGVQRLRTATGKLPSGCRPSWFLGVLGMPGATAYFGLLEVCQPKAGDTVLVSSCTGAVGQLVGQIAKIHGCRTIGMTSTGKLDVARGCGYDAVIDYTGKSVRDLIRELRAAAPTGINCYFDNSGGPCTEAALMCLALFARVAVCGQIAYYNLEDPLSAKAYPGTMVALTTQSRIEGFIVSNMPRASPGDWSRAFADLANWIDEGKLTVREDVSEGLENAFDEFLTLFHGHSGRTNVGKKILDIAATPLPLVNETAAPTSKL